MSAQHPLIRPVDPAPHRGETSLALLTFGLLAGPVAWALNTLLDYGLASYACFPRSQPRAEVLEGWEWLWIGLLATHLAGIALSLIAALLSFRVWRRTRSEVEDDQAGGLLETGEGRTRFLSTWGIFSGLTSAVAILFSGIAVIGLPICASLPPF